MRLGWAMVLLVLCLMPLAGATPQTPPGLIRITEADASLRPSGQAEQHRNVALRHRWDADFPGVDGSATYRVRLPDIKLDTQAAVLLERVGNQAVVTIDGKGGDRLGPSAAPSGDSNKRAHTIVLPPGARELQINVTTQALRGGGLSAVWIGPAAEIEARYMTRRFVDEVLPAAYAASLLLMGGLSAGLWYRQREQLFGCFSLAAFFGSIRHLDRIVPDAPLPWPLWGAVLAMAYGIHLALIGRFVLLVAGHSPRWLVRGFVGVLGAVVALAGLSFATGSPSLWTTALGLQLAFGLVCFGFVLRQALAQRRAAVWFVLGAGTLLLLAGMHDLSSVRTAVLGVNREPLAPHALFFFVLLLAGIVVERFSASVAEVRLLNQTLAQRVAERERQLEEAFEAIRVQREQEVAMNERQRITRDIHDGVGSQLVGLLSLVRQPERNGPMLEQHVNAALDELRMAVDSLQPVHGDLTTVLATLRYRLQPRLQAAGLQIVWDVVRLPLLDNLSPQAVLQVQRILLEALTNVIRHAQASSVTVRARLVQAQSSCLAFEVIDNGVGIPADRVPLGQGLRNMQVRAQAIGARLRVAAAPAGGTCVVLEWPLAHEPQATAAGEPHHSNAGGASGAARSQSAVQQPGEPP